MKNSLPKLNRRQFLALGGASAGLFGCICAAGAFAGIMIARRFAVTVTPRPTPTATSTPTPTPPTIVPRAAWNARPVNHSAAEEKGFASAGNPDGWYVYRGDLSQIYRTVAIHHSYPIMR